MNLTCLPSLPRENVETNGLPHMNQRSPYASKGCFCYSHAHLAYNRIERIYQDFHPYSLMTVIIYRNHYVQFYKPTQFNMNGNLAAFVLLNR